MDSLLSLLPQISVSLCLYFAFKFVTSRRITSPFPPGPPVLPLVGSTFSWPRELEWETFARWSKLYESEIIYARLRRTHYVIVNSFDDAQRILAEKGAMYSDRQRLYWLGKLVGWDNEMVLLDDGPSFRAQRKLFSQWIGTRTLVERHESVMQENNRTLLLTLTALNETEMREGSILQAMRFWAAATILKVTYGYEASSSQDELIQLAELVMLDWTGGVAPAASWVDAFPWLMRLPKWIPIVRKWTKVVEEMRTRCQTFVNMPYDLVREEIDSLDETHAKSTLTSLVGDVHMRSDSAGVDEHNLKWAAANMYGASVDTISSVLHTFVYFMAIHPEIQTRAKIEVDQIIGNSRLPALNDRPRMHYLEAVIAEVLRCGQFTPLGLAHRAREGAVYQGYWIPKDALIVPNIWKMARDPGYYSSPELFNPYRFLGPNPELSPWLYVLGFGRRACPGRLYAENNLFLACATMLATLEVSMVKDEGGKTLTPEAEYERSVVSLPKAFSCQIKPRSVQSELLLSQVH